MGNHHEPVLTLKDELGSEVVHYSVVYEGFPDEFKRTAERELNETEENLKWGLQWSKDFIKRKHITCLDEHTLLALLRNCKFNLKKSEAKLKQFLNKRKVVIEMLAEIEMDKIESILDDFCFGLLPYRDQHGRAVMYTRPYGLNLERYEVHDVGVLATVAILFIMKYPITSVAGYAFFLEGKSPSVYLFYPIFKGFRHFIFQVFSLPARLARVELLNEHYLCRCFRKVISPFIPKKILSRMSLHEDGYDSLHKLYDPNMLPEEFGGNMGPLKNESYKKKLLDFVRELKNENI